MVDHTGKARYHPPVHAEPKAISLSRRGVPDISGEPLGHSTAHRRTLSNAKLRLLEPVDMTARSFVNQIQKVERELTDGHEPKHTI